ncbi:MAG: ribbon-helix-helix domain-containing protein [Candidatus Hodarchaeales archaeon]
MKLLYIAGIILEYYSSNIWFILVSERLNNRDNQHKNMKSNGENIMRIITVHLPEQFIAGLDELVRKERYPNRSEAIRYSVRDLLKDELWCLREELSIQE